MQVCVHKMLKHESIIKFYGFRKDDNIQYIFLEYASGGELFDRIGEKPSSCNKQLLIRNPSLLPLTLSVLIMLFPKPVSTYFFLIFCICFTL